MSPESREHDHDNTDKHEENGKQLMEQDIKPENADVVKKLGFNLEKGEKIDQKTLEGKMGAQFDSMKNSVGNNPDSQAKLDGIKQAFLQTLGKETDVNKQLELCEQFLKEYDSTASNEKGGFNERADVQSKNMKQEAKIDAKKTTENNDIKSIVAKIAELQWTEEIRRREEKKGAQANMERAVSTEQKAATENMEKFQEKTNIV